VYSDYDSLGLSLSDSVFYRQLDRPMGVIKPSRRNDIVERYNDMVERNNEEPLYEDDQRSNSGSDDGPDEERYTMNAMAFPFHHGSHYSSPPLVIYYLIRLQPYTDMAINLQGGKFDKAD
jgi:hypothetical protein